MGGTTSGHSNWSATAMGLQRMVRSTILTVIGAVSALVPATGNAQIGLLLGAGGTFRGNVPSGVSYSGLGYNVLAGLVLRAPVLPIALRFEGQYDQFSSPLSVYQDRIYSATVNAEYTLPTPLVHPYLVGGGGYYHITARYFNPSSAPGSPSEIDAPTTGVGLNGGIGLRSGFGGVGFFGEWRYHYIFAGGARNPSGHTSYAPFTVGVTF
jgi:hypothetical protein